MAAGVADHVWTLTEIAGPVASDPVVSRLVTALAADAPRALRAIRKARAAAQGRSTSASTPVPATAYYGSFKIGPLCGQKAGDYGRGVSELHGKIVMHVGDLVSWRTLVVQAPGLANGSFASFRLRHGSGIYLNVTTKGATPVDEAADLRGVRGIWHRRVQRRPAARLPDAHRQGRRRPHLRALDR